MLDTTKAFRRLHVWKTIYVVSERWFVLTPSAIERLELYLTKDLDDIPTNETLSLERATGKDGDGTGEYEEVLIFSLLETLSS